MVNEASERSLAMLAFFIVSLFVLCNHFSNVMPWTVALRVYVAQHYKVQVSGDYLLALEAGYNRQLDAMGHWALWVSIGTYG